MVFHHSLENADFTGLRRATNGFIGIGDPQKAEAALNAIARAPG